MGYNYSNIVYDVLCNVDAYINVCKSFSVYVDTQHLRRSGAEGFTQISGRALASIQKDSIPMLGWVLPFLNYIDRDIDIMFDISYHNSKEVFGKLLRKSNYKLLLWVLKNLHPVTHRYHKLDSILDLTMSTNVSHKWVVKYNRTTLDQMEYHHINYLDVPMYDKILVPSNKVNEKWQEINAISNDDVNRFKDIVRTIHSNRNKFKRYSFGEDLLETTTNPNDYLYNFEVNLRAFLHYNEKDLKLALSNLLIDNGENYLYR